VVADVLSHKAHYNYLLVVRSLGKESITRVLPESSVYNIPLTSTLRSEIVAAQGRDNGMKHIKKGSKRVIQRLRVSMRIRRCNMV
jgi:hypothetical protein